MRITVVIHSLQGGGAERVTATLANAWVGRGHQVSIITLAGGDEAYPLRPEVDRISLDKDQPSRGAWSALRNNLGRLGALRRTIVRTSPDVVLAMMTPLGVMARLATIGLGVPVIASERLFSPLLPIGKSWQWLRQHVYPYTSAVVSQTAKGGAWIAENCVGSRSVVIANPVIWPLPCAAPKVDPAQVLPADRRLLLAAGRLEPQKGFDGLLDAFSRLAREFAGWDLAIIGEGRLHEDLQDQARRLGIADRVHLPGRVGNTQDWYERADLFVLSSKFEGFPNVLVEAMACGRPVVSFDCDTGPRDIIRHGVDGILVDPSAGASGLGDALASLMANDSLRISMGERAADVRSRFALDLIAGQWEALFADVCGARVASG